MTLAPETHPAHPAPPAPRAMEVLPERRVVGVPARSSALTRPRITEKATFLSERGVYVFEVSPRATKREVAAAVRELYKVTPAKVAMAPIPRKKILVKGKRGETGGGKKAYVYLKKGEKIEIS